MVLSSHLLPASYIANPLQVQWRWRPREIVGNCRGGKRCQILKRQREEPDSGWVLEVWTGAEGSGAPGIEGRIIGDRLRRDEGREQSDPAGEREKTERERKEERVRWGLKIQREAKERNEIQGMLEKPQVQNKENEWMKERKKLKSKINEIEK